MHAGNLKTSPRLQRALRALIEAKGEISTYELSRKADLCAVNSVIAELRENGAEISCQVSRKDGKSIFYYCLLKEPENWNA